ncbi:hypothetical protein B0H14DRAFT_3473056 [Mycena olivaceomarginata]|nr:hypothetical protein B0H14DRAFT_3473056 [Mycena olivaceomarginata]
MGYLYDLVLPINGAGVSVTETIQEPHRDDEDEASADGSEAAAALVVEYDTEQDDTTENTPVLGKRWNSAASKDIAVPFWEWEEVSPSRSASPRTRPESSEAGDTAAPVTRWNWPIKQ